MIEMQRIGRLESALCRYRGVPKPVVPAWYAGALCCVPVMQVWYAGALCCVPVVQVWYEGALCWKLVTVDVIPEERGSRSRPVMQGVIPCWA